MSVSLRPRFLAKQTSLIRAAFGLLQIVFGCKSTIEAGLEWIAAVKLLLPIEHWYGQVAIGRVAFKYQAVQDQIGGSAGQADFVTE
jgi:hypothetical protein